MSGIRLLQYIFLHQEAMEGAKSCMWAWLNLTFFQKLMISYCILTRHSEKTNTIPVKGWGRGSNYSHVQMGFGLNGLFKVHKVLWCTGLRHALMAYLCKLWLLLYMRSRWSGCPDMPTFWAINKNNPSKKKIFLISLRFITDLRKQGKLQSQSIKSKEYV